MRDPFCGARAILSGFVVCAVSACSAATGSGDPASDEADLTSMASVDFTAHDGMKTTGRPTAGSPLKITYALDRLTQCRASSNLGPVWTITGYYSENGQAAKTFEPTAVAADGAERIAQPTIITPSSGGDLAIWFQSTNRYGCSQYDSDFGQNFHVQVAGASPVESASIVFKKDGEVVRAGSLRKGGSVTIRYEQDRLPDCRRVERGNAVWAITGFASLAGAEPTTFETGRPTGPDREPTDAVVQLPRAGELALWFQVTSLGGCMAYDSRNGLNYRFVVE